MGQIGLSAGIGAGEGAVSGAVSGLLATSYLGPYGWIGGAVVGAVLGAAFGALGSYLGQPKTITKRHSQDLVETSSVRNAPVPILFGRGRLGGTYVAVGSFWNRKDYISNDNHRRIYVANFILGLAEGTLSWLGNHRLNSELLKTVRAREQAPCKIFRFNFLSGAPGQAGAPSLTDVRYGYIDQQPLQIPFRNTACLDVTTFCDIRPTLPQINIDAVGPDYTIRRSGLTAESNPTDIPGYGFYDGYSESFYATLTASTATGSPFGLVRYGRQGSLRSHTPPPTGISTLTHAWYWGKHDVLVAQDPSDSTLFHIGYWGIAQSAWKHVRPSNQSIGQGYLNPILAFHVDEQHSMVHTLHDDGAKRYVLRWNVLTDRIERMNTDLPSATWRAMHYSVDLARYLFADNVTSMYILHPDTGESDVTGAIDTSTCVGLAVSGQQCAVISPSKAFYYDVYSHDIAGPFGQNSTGVSVGALASIISATQNTFTGQTCVTKLDSGTACFINFIPSCVEDIRDINANGTSGLGGLPTKTPSPNNYGTPEPNFQGDQRIGSRAFPSSYQIGTDNPVCNPVSVAAGTMSPITDWCRDWSHRTYGDWTLTALEGNSSLAAAFWAICVDEPSLDSARFGAGFDAKYFSLPSVEGLHAWCVGAVRLSNPPDVIPSTRLAERYKFDFVLDAEMPVSAFVQQHILMACQGYIYSIGGQVCVGVPKPGILPVWHFSDRSTEDASFGVSFNSAEGINRVRVQYTNILDEYRHDFVEAEDQNSINATGRIQLATLTIDGCGRGEAAALLANTVLDQGLAGRRQAGFSTDYTGYILSPADAIEVSNAQCGMRRVRMRLSNIKESASGAKKQMQLAAIEYKTTLDSIDNLIEPPAQPGNGIGSGVDNSADCSSAFGPYTNVAGAPSYFNGGAALPAGTYTITYTSGTYSKTNAGVRHFVNGYEVITRIEATGQPVLLCPAPALADPTTGLGGYPDETTAETANFGQTTTFTLAAPGAVFLAPKAGITFWPGLNSPNVGYELCHITEPEAADIGAVAGIQLWLRADIGAYKDAGVSLARNNDTVRQWKDQSGNNNTANQTSAGIRPKYRTGQVASLPAVLFTASLSTYLDCGNVPPGATFAVFVVTRPTTTGTAQTVIAKGNSAATTDAMFFGNGTALSGFSTAPSTFQTVASPQPTVAQWVTEQLFYDGANLTTMTNGTVTATSAVVATPQVLSNDLIIGRLGDSTTQYLDADIAELILVSPCPVSTDRDTIESGLNAKYNVY